MLVTYTKLKLNVATSVASRKPYWAGKVGNVIAVTSYFVVSLICFEIQLRITGSH